MDVTDKISEVAIASAADFDEISTAIEKVASSAANAGLDLDHLMGYLGKMIDNIKNILTVPYNCKIILNREYAGKPLELLLPNNYSNIIAA